MLETLMHSPIAWAILAVITIISLAYAIICNQKNKEKKEFSYCLRSRTLIRKKKAKFEKLSIVYDGKQIDDLCVSNFTIWNSGNKTLNASDMVTSKELTITAIEDSKILDVEILKCSEETNKFSTQLLDEHTVKILFDYVDKMEGVVIQIIHTGTNDSLKIECKIKGGRPVRNYDRNRKRLEHFVMGVIRFQSQRYFAIYVTICMLFVFGFAVFFTLKVFDIDLRKILFPQKEMIARPSAENQSVIGDIVLSSVFWGYFLSLWVIGIPAIKRIFKIGMPKSLKKFSGFGD